VLLTGLAAGGLTQVPRETFRTCSIAPVIAGELGIFGVRPEVGLSPSRPCGCEGLTSRQRRQIGSISSTALSVRSEGRRCQQGLPLAALAPRDALAPSDARLQKWQAS
jgi:hypothetical protein